MKKSNIILLAVAVVVVMICMGAAVPTMVWLAIRKRPLRLWPMSKPPISAVPTSYLIWPRRCRPMPNTRRKHSRVMKARAAASQVKLDADNRTPDKLKAFQDAQGELTQALGKLMVVVERYPDLKASDNFHSLQIQLEGTENRINEARQKYNDAVQTYNKTVRSFPNVVFAGMFGFEKMTKFEAATGAEKAPELNFD